MHPPSDLELNELAAQVDSQLQDLLAVSPAAFQVRGVGETGGKLPAAPQQQAVIEQATGVAFESFWDKYLRHAKRDLCLPGGLLYEQWHKWRDLESKAAVRFSYGYLTAMGVSTAAIGPVAVAAAVIMLNIALKIGIDALCEDCTGATP